MSNVRAHVIISGHVQGVFYRASTQRQANAYGVQGWVRNLPDGRVEALFEGDQKAVQRMIDWCGNGPPNAYVTGIETSYEPYSGQFTGFNVRY